MIVQHNLMADVAANNLGVMSKQNAKHTEKLSSGYKINRASDDAAGLTISETMRRQIRGLSQASSNAQDGISLIQTAEGAMGEIHDMLGRMKELSVKSANETNTDADRQAIQEEINALTTEIDRISDSTEYNTKKLLDGSCSSSGISQDTKDKFISWLNGSWLNDAGTLIENTTGWKIQAGAELNVEFKEYGDSAVAAMGGSYLGKDLSLIVNTNFLKDNAVYQGTDGPVGGGISTDRVMTHEMVHGYMFQNTSSKAEPDMWFIEGIAEAVHGASDIRYGLYESGMSSNFSDINDSIQSFDFKNETGIGVYSVGYLATSYLKNSINSYAGAGTFKDMLAEMNQSDETFGQLVAKYTGKASYDNFITQLKSDAQAAMDAGTFDTSFLQGKCGINLTDGLADRIDGNDTTDSAAVPNSGSATPVSADTTTVTIGSTPVTVHWNQATKGGIILQIGAEKDNSMVLSLEAVTAKSIGVDTVSVLSKQGSKDAMKNVESAIDKVSKIRSKLGAYQNRLEHTIANLDNVVENTQSAESAIRDTDMANEMVSYSKSNILMQAGQAMIAQANQQPQGILALLG